MSKKFQTALWLIKLWLLTMGLFWSAATIGGWLGYLTVIKLTGQ